MFPKVYIIKHVPILKTFYILHVKAYDYSTAKQNYSQKLNIHLTKFINEG